MKKAYTIVLRTDSGEVLTIRSDDATLVRNEIVTADQLIEMFISGSLPKNGFVPYIPNAKAANKPSKPSGRKTSSRFRLLASI